MEHLDDEENITIIKDSLNNEELKVADKVAENISSISIEAYQDNTLLGTIPMN